MGTDSLRRSLVLEYNWPILWKLNIFGSYKADFQHKLSLNVRLHFTLISAFSFKQSFSSACVNLDADETQAW